MNSPSALAGWDVHTHIIPAAVIAAGERGLYGMHIEPKTLHISAHGVLSKSERASYTQIINHSLLSACIAHQPSPHPFAYLPIEDSEFAADVVSQLDRYWAGAVAGTSLVALKNRFGRQMPSKRLAPDCLHAQHENVRGRINASSNGATQILPNSYM